MYCFVMQRCINPHMAPSLEARADAGAGTTIPRMAAPHPYQHNPARVSAGVSAFAFQVIIYVISNQKLCSA